MPDILNKTLVRGFVLKIICAVGMFLLFEPRAHAGATDALPFLSTIPEAPLNFYGPEGVEFNTSDSYIYIVDSGNNTIQRIGPEGDVDSAWGGHGSDDSAFDSPTDITIDSDGNVYITDTDNDRVQKFNSIGDTLLDKWGSSGTGPGQFNSPTGIGKDQSDNIWVADTGNNRVQKFDSDGTYLDEFGGSGTGPGQFNNPKAIDLDTSGNIYVVDGTNNRVQKFNSSGGYLLEWGTSGSGNGQFSNPIDIEVNDLEVFVSDYGNNRVQKFETDGDYVGKFGSFGDGNGLLDGPTGLAWNGSEIIVVDTGNNRYQTFDGDTYTFSGKGYGASNEDGRFNYPMGLGLTRNGQLYVYVADTLNDRIQKVENSGNYITKWGTSGTGDGEFDAPVDAAVDGDGNVYVVDRDNNRIQKFDSDGNYTRQWGGSGPSEGSFNNPNGIVINADNYVYVADTDNDRVQEFDEDGTFVRTWGTNGSNNSEFNKPMDIALDEDGNVYVTDSLNNRVQKFTSTGTYTSQFGSPGTGDGQFDSPLGIAVDINGYTYVSDRDNFRIQKFNSDGVYLTEMGARGPTNGYFGTLGSDNPDFNHGPYRMAMDADGRLYVADPANNRIQILGEDFSEDSEDTSHIDFTHSKSSSDWYKNGTRIELSDDDGHAIEYQWVSGKDDHTKDNKWQDYKGSIKAKSGKNTLYWKSSGDTHHRYIKVKDKHYITNLKSSTEPNTKTITLSWKIQSSDKASKVKIYRDKYSSDFALDDNHLIGTNAMNDTTFIINNPNSWGNYYYRVVVYDKNGNEIQSSLIFVQVN